MARSRILDLARQIVDCKSDFSLLIASMIFNQELSSFTIRFCSFNGGIGIKNEIVFEHLCLIGLLHLFLHHYTNLYNMSYSSQN